MNLAIKITDVETVNQLDNYWTTEDYINLLKKFDFADVEQIKPNEILDYLNMAIGDFEPAEAAQIVLDYKLSEELNEGQIQNIASEMLKDKIAEEYPEPALHFDLFNVNQLLHRAYNGTFPNTEATIIDFQLEGTQDITKEILLKSLAIGLKEHNLVERLFEEQLLGNEPFGDAQKVIWSFKKENDTIRVITSKYWIEKNDFTRFEYDAEIKFYQED
jgi:hypothetical protein